MADLKTPTADAAFIAATVARSLPSTIRPRMKTETEARLAPIEAKAAAQYASMETLTRHFNILADEMDAELDEAITDAAHQLPAPPQDNTLAIPQEGEWEDSLVHNIEDARSKLIKK